MESIARRLPPSASDDFRNLMNEVILANLTYLAPGGNLIQPGGTPANSAAAPAGVSHTVTGGSGVATVAIQNPTNYPGQQLWHEVSYGPLSSFTKGVTTLEPTTSTNITIPNSGVSAYYRLRSSFDKVNWSPYQRAQLTPVDAGLVEADAMSAAGAFNQTNFAQINSPGAGVDSLITISGPGGPFTPYTAIRGTTQSSRPSATIVGSLSSFSAFVGWDGSQYQIKPTLANVLADNLEPVGKVVIGNPPAGGGGVNGSNGGRLTAV